tara:strand:+ start:325 stop:1362 length:1038 start_codon:yes stop_codon:yes gene_type:complete
MIIKKENIKNKRILITGGLGFIGSHLIRSLINNYNCNVLNLDSKSYCSMPEALIDLSNKKKYKFIKNNLQNMTILKKIILKFNPHFIFHLAAESHVDNSIISPDNFIKSNIIGTYNLINVLNNLNFKNYKFIHVSTDEVYGSLKNKKENAFTEKSKFLPNSPYSASKASSDLLVRAWNKTYNFPAIITNCVNNYGPWQFPEKLIPVVISKCLENKKIPVYGNGKNIREWIYVEDHVDILINIMISGKIGESYNIGTGYEIENIKLIQSICEYFDHNLSKKNSYKKLITFVKDRPAHDFRYALNTSKTDKIIKIKNQKNNFKFNLNKTIEWYINNRQWVKKRLSKI